MEARVPQRSQRVLPQALGPLLVLAQVEFGDDLAQLLRAQGLPVVVVAPDNALLAGREPLMFGHA